MTESAIIKKRLFFAAWPDQAVLEAISAAATVLRDYRGRAIATSNLHMTLVFVGNSDMDRQTCLESVASSIKSQSFNITLDRFGYFRKPQILWLGSTECPSALAQLVDELSAGFAECGYRPENPEYTPHVSLLRKADLLTDELTIDPITWPIDRFYLAESISIEGGVIYQKLKTYLL